MTTPPNHNTADQSGADERAISAAMSEGNKHGVKSTVSAQIIAAYLANSPAPTDFGIRWDLFPSYLLDYREGEIITEESLQGMVAGMLKSDDYKRIVSQTATPQPFPAPAAHRSGPAWLLPWQGLSLL